MGALPNIHKIISLSELELKNVPKETESQLIENLEKIKIQEPKKAVAVGAAMSTHLHGTPKAFQNDDAPMCSNCGASMIRNGTCYKCLDCGETSGCS
jgi:hypothetical protein